MKNYTLISAFVLVSFLQSFAYTVPKSSTFDFNSNEKSVVISLQGIKAGANTFSITNTKGDVIFTEYVNSAKRGIKYNLEKLPLGKYMLKLEGDNFVEYSETIITTSSLSVENSEIYYQPVVKNENKKLMINALMAKTEAIKVSIYDKVGNLVYDYNDKIIGSYSKTFNLKNLSEGNYSVFVSTDHFQELSEISL